MIHMSRRVFGSFRGIASLAAMLALIVLWPAGAGATTKGLNQIVTPDIQSEGLFSVSLQQVDPSIGNRYQLQLEQGISKNFEVAYFHGFSPPTEVLNAELGLVQKPPYLLSTGFLGWSSNGLAPQPFLEAGYYKGNWELLAGAVRTESQAPAADGSMLHHWETDTLVGAAYRATGRLQLQADYQAGAANFATAGVTYNLSPELSFNPALYVSNAAPRKGYGYVVLTWSIQAFK